MYVSMNSARTAVLGLALGIALVGCDSGPKVQKQQAKAAVVVATVGAEAVVPFKEFVGRTEASEDVQVNARVSGPLIRRDFSEGQDVEKGALLFQIDPAPYAAQLAQAEAQLKQAQSTLKVAINNFKRGEEIFKKGVISAMEMDKLTGDKLTAEAAVTGAEATVEEARLNLSYTNIYAPISGRISRSQVSIGDLISPQTPMATLVQLDPIWVNFQASEKAVADARQTASGDASRPIKLESLVLSLVLPNGDTYEEQGKIDFVDNRVDAQTGTIGIRATFPNPHQGVLPGMFATVLVKAPASQQALLIPQIAIQEDQQGRFVMVVGDDNKVSKRLVKMGKRYGIKWEVDEGLSEGEKIVVEGLQKIREGAEVTYTEQTVEPFAEKSV